MSKYAAKIEDGIVVQVVRGDAAWSSSRLGGSWVGSESKVGVGWEESEEGLRPVSPFPSWSWDGDKWVSPVPYPDDENFYEWDEDTQTWEQSELEA
jgi:hypothetical protein